jgi:hypothetical protein
MLSLETQKKYIGILKKGNTLKIDPLDAIELVEKFEELKKVDQIGTITDSDLFKERLKKCKDKIIMKHFTLWNQDNKDILYWSPCSLNDIISLAGAEQFNPETNMYEKLSWVQRNEQLCFLGQDIKKAGAVVNNSKGNSLTNEFSEKYINTEHPIADNIFYTVYIKSNDDSQVINCSRNTTLSPRPEKKKDS